MNNTTTNNLKINMERIKKKMKKFLNHATEDDYEEIMDVFKQHKELFPHIRGDKIMRQIKDENVVWEDGVLITYNHYKRKQKVGKYQAHRFDCILHQIAAHNQGNGSAKKVFEKFIYDGNKEKDVILSVRSENKRAIKFYEKYNFKLKSKIEWGKTNQVKGEVYLLEQKPYYKGYYKLGVIKHLDIEPSLFNFDKVLDYIDNTEFSKVKTKYSKGDDWTAISLRGYGPTPLDILKPNVLKSKVKVEAVLQDTSLLEEDGFQVINDILAKIPSTFERVRFMKIKANSSIGKHSDKIDKDFGLEDGNIVRIHVPIRTNDQVNFLLWEGKKKTENYLEEGHYYYVDVTAPHAVKNNSDVDRIHLVIDTYVTDEVRELLEVETF